MREVSSNTDNKRDENPREHANCISACTFWYTFKIFKKGMKRDLDEDDLTKPLHEHKSEYLGQKMARLWSKEVDRADKRKRKPSLAKVILQMFLTEIFFYGILVFTMEIIFRMNQPLFLGFMLRYYSLDNQKLLAEENCSPKYMNRVIHYFQEQSCRVSESEAYFYGAAIVICSSVAILVMHPYLLGVMHIGMKMRIACCSLIYRKVLRIDFGTLSGETVGQAVNLLSNDVNRFDIVPIYYNYLWISPIQTIFITLFIYNEVGFAAVIGMIAVIIFIPLQIWFGNTTSHLRLKTAERTDDRVRLMNEVIQAMEVIKMYAWEHAFSRLVHKSRKNEINVLKYTAFIKGMIMSFIMFTARGAIFLTILYYVLNNNKGITAETAFLIAAYYQVVRVTMTVYFPQGIAQVAEAAVAINRIRNFLLSKETNISDPTPLDPDWRKNPMKVQKLMEYRRENFITDDRNVKIIINDAWAKFSNTVCLRNVNLTIQPGILTAVVGQVGSGKSCLLHLILGEIVPFQGRVKYNGTISYASQEPWLFAGSVRQNIIFGRPYSRRRYREIMKVCALERDFMLLPYGDRTIVGERGISLSGGQRARINLARAVYKEADIYLLDDPLSAVDSQVGKQLFETCIAGYLKSKIVILVTHQLQFLQFTDRIIIMEHGRIKADDQFESLQMSSLNYAKLLSAAAQDIDISKSEKLKTLQKLTLSSVLHETLVDRDDVFKGYAKYPEEEAEMRTYGSVDAYVYKEYFTAGGNWCSITIMVMLFFGAQAFGSFGDFFLCVWVNLEEARSHNRSVSYKAFVKLTRKHCYTIYSIIIILTAIVAITRSFYFFITCMRASIKLHDRMFNSIIRASMRFFKNNTSGRILNRFSKDLGAIDELLPNAMIDSSQIILNLLGVVGIIAAVQPIFLIPTLLLCVAFYFIRRFYLKTSRSVKRLEGITRSPIFAHLNATLQGLSTIRSNSAEMILVSEFDRYQDIHSSAWFIFLSTSRAFGYWLDILCTVYIGLITFYFLTINKDATGGEVGLSITQAIGLTGLFQWGMRQSAELENQMTSVERVLEYTRIEHEADLNSTPDMKPPGFWPDAGRIEFKNATMKYSPDEPPVLHSLNFVINPKEKIGIVGRTGAGKSSLIASLFRLAYFEGEIIIDGIEISKLGLHDLRKKISIIPQEPIIFSGTLRYNLDPFNEYDDQAMFNALVIVEIQAAIEHGIDCLEFAMTEGGTNLSVGQRQMVCLARAILRNNIILIMDEATANIDPQTDKFIQSTIRTKFENCTLLTIAHRLHTIMDYDRVLVMDSGCCVEFDEPWVLLQNPNGYFTVMVQKTGRRMEENLRKIAQEAYGNRGGPGLHRTSRSTAGASTANNSD